MKKKGYIRTLEAFIAFFLTFLFMVFVVLKGIPEEPERTNFHILENLEQQDSFRRCVYEENITCMDEQVRESIPLTYDHKITINNPKPPQTYKNTYTETLFMTSNQTSDYKVIYLYYWAIG